MPTEADRFWAKVNKTDECWLWTGGKAKGYGTFGVGRRMVLAHRFVLQLVGVSVPQSATVCHRCDTPLCVRPDHLFVGSRKDNSQDAKSKGRLVTPRRKLNTRQESEVRSLRSDGWTIRKIADLYGVGIATISATIRRR